MIQKAPRHMTANWGARRLTPSTKNGQCQEMGGTAGQRKAKPVRPRGKGEKAAPNHRAQIICALSLSFKRCLRTPRMWLQTWACVFIMQLSRPPFQNHLSHAVFALNARAHAQPARFGSRDGIKKTVFWMSDGKAPRMTAESGAELLETSDECALK